MYTRWFRIFLDIKVSRYCEDSQQGRLRTTSILVRAFWNFKLKVLKYSRNCSLPNVHHKYMCTPKVLKWNKKINYSSIYPALHIQEFGSVGLNSTKSLKICWWKRSQRSTGSQTCCTCASAFPYIGSQLLHLVHKTQQLWTKVLPYIILT